MSATVAAAKDRRRLFFALWPDEDTRARLDALAGKAQAAFGGRRMRADTLHMTLVFLGEVDAAGVDSAMATADRLGRQGGFSMRIDQLRCWARNRIVWCGPTAVPAALSETAKLLGGRLSALGFRLEARAFAAHATLLRNADCSGTVPDFVPFEWEVEQIVLVESSLAAAGTRYQVIGRWPLAG